MKGDEEPPAEVTNPSPNPATNPSPSPSPNPSSNPNPSPNPNPNPNQVVTEVDFGSKKKVGSRD